MTPDVVVIDTDVWSLLFAFKRREDERVPRWRVLLTGKSVVIAAQTRAEVLAWMYAGDLGADRADRVRSQLDATPTVPVDEQVIQRFARLSADAKRRGDALGNKAHTADRWIAATSLTIGAPLLAGDRIYRNDPDLVLLGRDEP